MVNQLAKAEAAIEHHLFFDAITLLDEYLVTNTNNLEALLLRSRVFQKLSEWSKALNDLNRILEIAPENKLALTYKTMIIEIMKFKNTDLYNP